MQLKNRYKLIIITVLLLISVSVFMFFNARAAGKKQNDDNYNKIKEAVLNPDRIKDIPFSMRIICLSLASDGLRNLYLKDSSKREEIKKIISGLVNIASGYRACPYKNIFDADFVSLEHGLYLSHLNVILGNFYFITNDLKYAVLHRRLNQYLISKTLSSNDFHIRSFPGINLKYPADQAVTVYSIWLYDEVFKTDIGRPAVAGWLKYIKKRIGESQYKLPPSEITGNIWYASYPRGCATSYIVYYMSYFALDDSKSVWKNYKNKFKGSLIGNVLFKEWIENKKDIKYSNELIKWKKKYGYAGDADSGPVILGYGAAATGLGLPASKAVNDKRTYHELLSSVTNGFKILGSIDKNALNKINPFMTAAIMFAAQTI